MWIVLIGAATALALLSFAPPRRASQWWVRLCDFPRLQLAAAAALVALLAWWQPPSAPVWGARILATAALLYQLWWIAPYTPLLPRQVQRVRDAPAGRSVSLLISNVLMGNRNSAALLAQVQANDPDLILTLESDRWWQDALSGLQRDYPECVHIPRDNLYGMHLWSRLPLEQVQVLYRVQADIPSIHCRVRLPAGDTFTLHCLHPRPPAPSENDRSAERDAELLLVGREVRAGTAPTIVAGDLNDVAWSPTTRLFQRVSGLLDPRRGRGFYNTFHARIPILRWPLDHVFHSPDWGLSQLRRLPGVGSDHFPIFVRLTLVPKRVDEQEAPEPEPGDNREARERIAEARA